MKIRVLSIGLIENKGKIFVGEGFDSVKQQLFYRPLGGGIEFGETGEEALRREFQEEINAELTHVEFLRIFENLFTFEGVKGREIVLVYKASFVAEEFTIDRDLTCNEEGTTFIAKWVSVDEFTGARLVLFSAGLTEYLAQR